MKDAMKRARNVRESKRKHGIFLINGNIYIHKMQSKENHSL